MKIYPMAFARRYWLVALTFTCGFMAALIVQGGLDSYRARAAAHLPPQAFLDNAFKNSGATAATAITADSAAWRAFIAGKRVVMTTTFQVEDRP